MTWRIVLSYCRFVHPPSLRATLHWELSGSGERETGFVVHPRKLHRTLFEVAERGSWRIDQPGRSVLQTQPGQVFVVPANQPHLLRQTGRASISRWWTISLTDATGRDLFGGITGAWLLSAATSRRLLELLDRSAHGATPTLLEQLDAQASVLTIVRLLLSECPEVPVPTLTIDPRIDAVLQHVSTHLGDRLPRSALAAIAHVSLARFHELFTSEVGMSPGAFVRTQRLLRAQELLLTTDEPVKRIAEACGYPDAGRFSRTFRAELGMPPVSYRALMPRRAHGAPDAPPAPG